MTSTTDWEYVDEEKINQDLLCSICIQPFVEPVCCESCGNTFCQGCINIATVGINTCPMCRCDAEIAKFKPVNVRAFLNQLNQLIVKCTACSTTNIQRGNFDEHIKRCPARSVECPAAELNCTWTGSVTEMESHVHSCTLVQVQPIFTELNEKLRAQSEQMKFLYKILETMSDNYKSRCTENYREFGFAFCDFCGVRFKYEENPNRFHFCPNTDFCDACLEERFPSNENELTD